MFYLFRACCIISIPAFLHLEGKSSSSTVNILLSLFYIDILPYTMLMWFLIIKIFRLENTGLFVSSGVFPLNTSDLEHDFDVVLVYLLAREKSRRRQNKDAVKVTEVTLGDSSLEDGWQELSSSFTGMSLLSVTTFSSSVTPAAGITRQVKAESWFCLKTWLGSWFFLVWCCPWSSWCLPWPVSRRSLETWLSLSCSCLPNSITTSSLNSSLPITTLSYIGLLKGTAAKVRRLLIIVSCS